MPGTYSQILLHITFSTKHREPWITPETADRLYPYMGGIVRAEKGVLCDIGGVADHVHMYLRWRPDESVSDLLRTVKARSSLWAAQVLFRVFSAGLSGGVALLFFFGCGPRLRWVRQTFPALGAFAGQEGYSVFSVSKSLEDAVKKYIANQAEHHTKEDFKSELLRLLRAHGIEFDERYVFD